MIKLTRRLDGADSDCFVSPLKVLIIVQGLDGFTFIQLDDRNYVGCIVQTPAEVMALIEEARG